MVLPRVTPLRVLISRFRDLGWDGPFSGGRHQFMVKGPHKQRIPNAHGSDDGVRVALLKEILRQAGVTEEEWTDG